MSAGKRVFLLPSFRPVNQFEWKYSSLSTSYDSSPWRAKYRSPFFFFLPGFISERSVCVWECFLLLLQCFSLTLEWKYCSGSVQPLQPLVRRGHDPSPASHPTSTTSCFFFSRSTSTTVKAGGGLWAASTFVKRGTYTITWLKTILSKYTPHTKGRGMLLSNYIMGDFLNSNILENSDSSAKKSNW